MHRAVGKAAALLAVTLMMSACSSSAPSPSSSSPSSSSPSSSSPSSSSPSGSAASGTINAWVYSDPSGFDPALAAGVQTFQFDRQLYDTLLRRDEDNNFVGGLASEWTAKSVSEYSFKIRDGATCSDGTPITASVVAASLTYLANPATKSTWSALVFGQGTPTITADDATSTVVIKLSKPFGNLESGLTVAQTGIICPAGLANLDGLKAGSVAGAFSGPYALTESKPGLGYTLTFRKDYSAWPAYKTPLEGHPAQTIVYTLGNDESTTANQMLAGQIDFANLADWNTIARFKGNDKFTQTMVTAYTTYVVFNQRPGQVFADRPDLRKAVAQSIDQAGFNTVFSNGNNELLTSIVPSTYACVNKDKSLLTPVDLAAAKSVLSGVTGIKLLGNTANTSFSNGADYLYAAMTAAGAGVTMNKVDNATFWSTLAKGGSDWDVTFLGDQNAAQAISASLDRNIGPSVEDGGRNFSASKNPVGEAALNAGLATLDQTERCTQFEIAQKSLFDRSDVKPLVGGSTMWIYSANVTARHVGEDVDAATWRLNN